MPLPKPLSNFIIAIVQGKKELSKGLGFYISEDDKHKLTVSYHLQGAPAHTFIRVGATTNNVQTLVELFLESDMSICFWIVWAFIRKDNESDIANDKVAMALAYELLPNTSRTELKKFHDEYLERMKNWPSATNLDRAKRMMVLVTDYIVKSMEA